MPAASRPFKVVSNPHQPGLEEARARAKWQLIRLERYEAMASALQPPPTLEERLSDMRRRAVVWTKQIGDSPYEWAKSLPTPKYQLFRLERHEAIAGVVPPPPFLEERLSAMRLRSVGWRKQIGDSPYEWAKSLPTAKYQPLVLAQLRDPNVTPAQQQETVGSKAGIEREESLDVSDESAREVSEMEASGPLNRALSSTDEQSFATATKYHATTLQTALASWMGEVKWNLMITLTFKGDDGVTHSLATRLFGRFRNRFRKDVLRTGRQVNVAAVIENSREMLKNVGVEVDGREGTHIHVLLRVREGDDPYKYKDAIENAWKKTNWRCGDPKVCCPDSDKWYLPLTNAVERERYTGYMLKQNGTDAFGLIVPYLNLD